MSRPSLERVHELLRYDPDTGLFFWRVKRNNFAKAGSEAGWWSGAYRYIHVDNQGIPAHRLAWFIVHGEWPKQHIDHIDCDPSNNRIENLRDVSRAENMRNQKSAHKGSAVGLIGVAKWRGKFKATISVNGKAMHIGTFNNAGSAYEAYKAAKAIHHGVQL